MQIIFILIEKPFRIAQNFFFDYLHHFHKFPKEFFISFLENVDKTSKVNAEEVFGPIFNIEIYSDFKKAVEIVNDSKFGLQAGIFSSNIDKCFYAFNNIEVGAVIINDVPSIRVDSQPYGGVKDSGLGREGLKYAIEDMTEIRAMVMKKIGDF